jgi:sigma-B regulation protein RsbU (phosphoserine phosphatase)
MAFWRRKQGNEEVRPGATPGGESPVGGRPADPTEGSRYLTGDALEDRRRTESLLEEFQSITDRVVRIGSKDELDDLLTYIVDASVRRTGSERGMLILDAGGGELAVRIARQRGERPLEDLRFSTSVVSRVLETGQPLKDISSGENADLGASVFDLKLRSLMCVPVTAGEGDAALRGVLYVDSRAATREFGHSDLAYFSALSTQIVSALKSMAAHLDALERARLEASLDGAGIVQNHLMPQVPDDVEGYELFGWYRAAERTSGDFYDFFRTRDGRLGVVVGDVTGHGPASALITSQVQASLRSTLRIVPDLREAVTLVNQDLSERIQVGNFVTLFVALLGADGVVELVNAGHTPPRLWVASAGEVRTLRAHGPALGMMEDFRYDELDRIELGAGDVLLAFTDGLSEARNPAEPDRMLGEEGVESLLVEHVRGGGGVGELAERILAGVHAFAGEVCEDDMTLVAVRRTE